MALYEKQPKKLHILYILNILQKYSDADHTLSQQDIIKLMKSEYGMEVDRKTIKRNLDDLIDSDYPIEYTETKRTTTNPKTGKPEETNICSDFYIEHDFTASELRLLIDSLLFSTHIPYNQCRDLVEKLEKLSNKYFRSRIRHIYAMHDTRPHNNQLFMTIDILDEAIENKKQVSFNYCSYGTDMKMHKRTDDDDNAKEFIMNPYQMAAKDGNYYLICNREGYPNLSNYRIDRIKDIKLLDSRITPYRDIKASGKQKLELEKYMDTHSYMFTGEQVNATLKVSSSIISDVIDRFGTDISFSGETKDSVNVRVSADSLAIFQFAKNYSPLVKIISPKKLVDRMKNEIDEMKKLYE